MDIEKPYITKRPHKKSRNGCISCKARKQKCDEVKPTCGSCKKRNVPCQYAPKLPSKALPSQSTQADDVVQRSSTQIVVRRSSSASATDGFNFDSQEASSDTTVEDIAQNDKSLVKRQPTRIEPVRSLQLMPWRNKFEHQLYDCYYNAYQTMFTRNGTDGTLRQIWLDLVPRIALTTDRTLFVLLLSFGSLHSAVRMPDYPSLRPGTQAARLWNISMRYFAEGVTEFRNKITTKKMYDQNPEVFSLIALVLSARTGMIAVHRHADAESLYDDHLAWFSAALGYIGLGGFYARQNSNTRLGRIMKASPQSIFHLHPFLESIKSQNFPDFDYLHPIKDKVTEDFDPDDLTKESLETYTTVLKLVGWVSKLTKSDIESIVVFGAHHQIPFSVPYHFLELLRARRPRAVAILAHHMALTAFLGTRQGFHFWPREDIQLLRTMVPLTWSWAFDKAIELVNELELLRDRSMTVVQR